MANGTTVGRIEDIRRYPVKSMGGEQLATTALGARGIPGDRAWAVRDEVNGGIRGAKKIPGLMRLAAAYPEPPPAEGSSPAVITFPDGTTCRTGDADVNERLSRALDHRVSLWPLLPADALDHYRRGAPTHADFEQEMRAVFGRAEGEPLPDLTVFPPELFEYESPLGTYFDAFPLLVVTTGSLGTMASRRPASRFDVRRFRPNLLIATDEAAAGDGFPEAAWAGRRLSVGDAVLQLLAACPRCVMTTHGFGDLPKDPGVMRALVQETGGLLGVYASVETPGTVGRGDSVTLLD
ncbi:MAG: MOSC domain-containing protein [Deltaproteobacteria bacterium]|nr:MOSC domain-containing protein [Deltaproteobacteria bacterium]